MKFSVAHPNPGKRSAENFTKISRQISRHLWQRKTEKIFTPHFCRVAALTVTEISEFKAFATREFFLRSSSNSPQEPLNRSRKQPQPSRVLRIWLPGSFSPFIGKNAPKKNPPGKSPAKSSKSQRHAKGGATKGGVSKSEQTQTNADKR